MSSPKRRRKIADVNDEFEQEVTRAFEKTTVCSAKFVYLWLRLKGEATSQVSLARELNFSANTLSLAIKELRRLELIEERQTSIRARKP